MKRSLRRIARMRGELLTAFGRLDREALEAKPGGLDTWSLLDVVEHLVLAEEVVLAGIADPRSLPARPRSPIHFLRYGIVFAVLAFGIPVKVPSRRMKPAGGVAFADLRRRWDRSQELLRGHVDTATRGELGRAIFEHPVCGPLSTRQAVWLLEIHLRRHRTQIRRSWPPDDGGRRLDGNPTPGVTPHAPKP